MGTWDVGPGEIDCPHCGAKHEYVYHDYPQRDRGSQNCLACGKLLTEWRGTRDYSDFKLVKASDGH